LADFSEGSNLRTVEAELMTSLRIWGPFCTQKLNSGVASVSSQTVRRQVSFNLQKFYSALHKISHTSDRGSLPEDFFHQPNREQCAVGCMRAHLFRSRQVLIFSRYKLKTYKYITVPGYSSIS